MKPIIIRSRYDATTTKYTFLTDSFSVVSSCEDMCISLVFKDSMGREEVVVQSDYLPSDFIDFETVYCHRYQNKLREEIIEIVQDYVEDYLLSDQVILDAHAVVTLVAANALKFYHTYVSNCKKEESAESTTQIFTPLNEE